MFQATDLPMSRRRALRLIYILLVCTLFSALFIFSWTAHWQTKYRLFAVPANSWPGGDSRTIQVAAYCAAKGFSYFGSNECQQRAEIVKRIYPQASVPPLDYPSLWARIYGFFGDSSENFFRAFWTANGLAVVAVVLVMSWRTNSWLMPLVALLAPPTLLGIERGNTDELTFGCVFLPLLLLRTRLWQGLLLGFAAALKIFPIFGFFIFLHKKNRLGLDPGILIGALLSLPLLALSISELPHFIGLADKGFAGAYGLPSILYAPYVSDHPTLGYAWMLAVALIAIAAAGAGLGTGSPAQNVARDVNRLSTNDRLALMTSLTIFVATFFCFTNWSYRLIFLIPAVFISAKAESCVLRIFFVGALLALWAPMVPYGWILLNLVCAPLAVMGTFLLAAISKNFPAPIREERRNHSCATEIHRIG